VLLLEVLLEHVVLLLGEARLHVALGGLLRGAIGMRGPACFLRLAGRVHGWRSWTAESEGGGRRAEQRQRGLTRLQTTAAALQSWARAPGRSVEMAAGARVCV
jgi:hypothetical protein